MTIVVGSRSEPVPKAPSNTGHGSAAPKPQYVKPPPAPKPVAPKPKTIIPVKGAGAARISAPDAPP